MKNQFINTLSREEMKNTFAGICPAPGGLCHTIYHPCGGELICEIHSGQVGVCVTP